MLISNWCLATAAVCQSCRCAAEPAGRVLVLPVTDLSARYTESQPGGGGVVSPRGQLRPPRAACTLQTGVYVCTHYTRGGKVAPCAATGSLVDGGTVRGPVRGPARVEPRGHGARLGGCRPGSGVGAQWDCVTAWALNVSEWRDTSMSATFSTRICHMQRPHSDIRNNSQ